VKHVGMPSRLEAACHGGAFDLGAVDGPGYVALGETMTFIHTADLLYTVSGLCVGFLVGMTGVGGGSLMTPLLILLLGVHPRPQLEPTCFMPRPRKRLGHLSTGSAATSIAQQFGFYITPGPQTGDLMLDFLVPDNLVSDPAALSFSIAGTQGGTSNSSTLSAQSSLFNATAWTTGNLSSYLGLTAATGTPVNGIRFWLPLTQAIDPGNGLFRLHFRPWDRQITEREQRIKRTVAHSRYGRSSSLIAGEVVEATGAIGTSENGGAMLVVQEPSSLAVFAVGLLALCASASYRQGRHLTSKV
jgi:hypothetical protein